MCAHGCAVLDCTQRASSCTSPASCSPTCTSTRARTLLSSLTRVGIAVAEIQRHGKRSVSPNLKNTTGRCMNDGEISASAISANAIVLLGLVGCSRSPRLAVSLP